MNTKEIMEPRLRLAGLQIALKDSAIYVNGANIEKILFCIDADVSELLLERFIPLDA